MCLSSINSALQPLDTRLNDKQDWQVQMSAQVITTDDPGWSVTSLRYVAGLDISAASDDRLVVCLSLLSFPQLQKVTHLTEVVTEHAEYQPGLLGFRESPHYVNLINRLFSEYPYITRDIIVFIIDGNGVLHERRFGSACHVGLAANVISIGVAKNYYLMSGLPPEPPLVTTKGDWCELGSIAAAVVKTADAKPIFVSVGHRISLASSIAIVLQCCPKYRIPEPIRAADHLSRLLAKQHMS